MGYGLGGRVGLGGWGGSGCWVVGVEVVELLWGWKLFKLLFEFDMVGDEWDVDVCGWEGGSIGR